MINIICSTLTTPLGNILLGAFHDSVCLCSWTDGITLDKLRRRLSIHLDSVMVNGSNDIIAEASAQLRSYFAGTRQDFSIPMTETGTAFQRAVWNTIKHVPYGQTASYRDIAQRMGRPTAIRAVANAIAANPIMIFCPCHRIIGTNGAITGYAGGIDTKRRLLELEHIKHITKRFKA